MWHFWKKKEETDREIFRYFDGKQMRAIDPLPVWRAMWDDPDTFDPKEDIHAAEQDANWERVTTFVEKHFKIIHFDPVTEEGLMISEITQLLWEYFAFINEIKKKRGMPLTASPPSDTNSSPIGSEEATQSDLGSSSTKEESPSDEPLDSSTPSSVEWGEESTSPGTTP
jgi:hypothetical protein